MGCTRFGVKKKRSFFAFQKIQTVITPGHDWNSWVRKIQWKRFHTLSRVVIWVHRYARIFLIAHVQIWCKSELMLSMKSALMFSFHLLLLIRHVYFYCQVQTLRIISFTSPHFPGSLYWLAVHLVRCTSSLLSRWAPTENGIFKNDWGSSDKMSLPWSVHIPQGLAKTERIFTGSLGRREFHFHNVLHILEVLKITSLQ